MAKKEEFIKDISLTNCSTYRGHDGDGYLRCDIKYKGKVVAEMHEDAWGGGYMYAELDKKAMKTINDAFKTFPRDKSYGIVMDDSLDYLVEKLFRVWLRKKDEKKGIQIETNSGYDTFAWNVQLPTLVKKYKNGLEIIQKDYDKFKKEKKTILNADYLEKLGVKL